MEQALLDNVKFIDKDLRTEKNREGEQNQRKIPIQIVTLYNQIHKAYHNREYGKRIGNDRKAPKKFDVGRSIHNINIGRSTKRPY